MEARRGCLARGGRGGTERQDSPFTARPPILEGRTPLRAWQERKRAHFSAKRSCSRGLGDSRERGAYPALVVKDDRIVPRPSDSVVVQSRLDRFELCLDFPTPCLDPPGQRLVHGPKRPEPRQL